MSTSIWGEKLVELIGHNGIGFKDGVSVRATNANPVASGLEAQLGSVCLWVDKAFIKTGPADNAWTEIATQAFIDAVTTLINDHIADATDAHDATAISSTNTLGANVELVLTALKNYKDLGLQSAYNGYPDITVDAVNPIKIKNIAGDTQPYPLQVRSNDEGDIYFAAGKDNTFMKNVTFSSDPTKKIELTDNSNIKITDSLGTNLFRKDFNELYVEDFKENLPSAVLTASNAAITINDAANANYLSNTITTFTQSSALTGYYVESDAIAITNNNKWLLEPIKIQSMQGISGGAGTWDFRIFTSTDGVSYADKKVAVQLGDLNNDKIITQLDNDTTHVKLRWTIVNPDNATTLTLGGFIITSDAFPVGQTTVINSVSLSGNDSRAITANTEDIQFNGSGVGWETSGDSHTYRVQYSNSEIRLSVCAFFIGTASRRLSLYKNGVAYKDISDKANDIAHKGDYTSSRGEFSAGDLLSIRVDVTSTLSNSDRAHHLNIVEEAYADNVIVDAATSGLNTRSAGALTISATTTAPTKGTVVTDKVWVVYNANDTATIRFEYSQSTAGTAGSGDYLFKMPSGLEIDTDKVTTYSTVEGIGAYAVPNSVGFVSFGYQAGDSGGGSIVVYDKDYVRIAGFHDANEGYIGSGYFGLNLAGISYSGSFTVPIKGRSIDSLPVMLDLSNERQNSLSLSGNDGRAITANTESIPFGTGTAGTTYKGWTYGADGSTGLTGNNYTVQKSGSVITLSGAVLYTTGATRNVDLYKNNAFYKRISGDTLSTASIVNFYYKSAENEFLSTDKLSIHGFAGTLSNSTSYHYLTIVEEYAPKAFVANAVSLTNHVIGGQEYWTGEKVGNKKVYARMWQITADSGANILLGTIDTNLIVLNGAKITSDVVALDGSYMYLSTQYLQKYYNVVSGEVRIYINNITIRAGEILFIKYVYP